MTRAEILRALKANVITVERAKELLSSAPDEPASRSSDRRVAIISMAGRFPRASDVDAFWANLTAGRDGIEEIPASRWDDRQYRSRTRGEPGTSYCPWGGFIDDVDRFDPGFFRISPREAQMIDPQERLLLQVVWTLFERIGYTRRAIAERFGGKVGMFAASMYHQYHSFDADLATKAAIAMSSHASIANRISNFLGFTGPSVAVDTMCSSSGTALHMACQTLLAGESALAVVGAANLSIHPYKYVALSQASLLASGTDARAFGDGDGFIPAEAVGAVLLKRLDRALEDDDPIVAVISSTTINHKGHSDGFNVPAVGAIAQLIEDNHAEAGVPPSAVGYVECAATGAPLADAAEIDALQRAYAGVAGTGSIRLGSVKSNIGHPEAAAGLCQLIKVALQLQHGYFVPTLGSERLNPKIDLEGSPFRVQRVAEPWLAEAGVPRRAAIQTLGAGGSNSHVLLEEHRGRRQPEVVPAAEPQILVFSARNMERLTAVVGAMLDHFVQHPPSALDAVAYTLQLGREEMAARAAVVVDGTSSVVHRLQDCLHLFAEDAAAPARRPAFVHDLGAEAPGDAGEHLAAALAARDLDGIARQWTRGAHVPWHDLHRRDGVPVRHGFVSLPTYPFARVRCWLPARSAEPTRPPASEPPAPASDPSDVRKVVLAEIGKLTGLQPGSFHVRQPLTDLGLNSVTRLLLATSLCRALPFLSESRDGARLVACKSAEELVACIDGFGLRAPDPEEPLHEGYSFRCGSSDLSALDARALERGAVVIGAGPAGLMAALTLRANGVPICPGTP